MNYRRVFKRWTKVSPDQQKFQNLLGFARQVAETNPSALFDVVRLYLRPLQADFLLSCAESEMHGTRKEIDVSRFFMHSGPPSVRDYWNYPRCEPKDFRVDLAHDPVFPCPWHRDRYVDALIHIGKHKKCGDWRQDINHRVIVLLPWRIAFVMGGNHSIASGVLNSEVSITPIEVYEMSGLLDAVVCDGENYLNAITRNPICRVSDYRVAAVFEVGRLMQTYEGMPKSAMLSVADVRVKG
jgi:hypothetical protein